MIKHNSSTPILGQALGQSNERKGKDGHAIENYTFSEGWYLGNQVERDQCVQEVPSSMVAILSLCLSEVLPG